MTPEMVFNIVDLPAPFGPSKPVMELDFATKSTSLKTNFEAYFFVKDKSSTVLFDIWNLYMHSIF